MHRKIKPAGIIAVLAVCLLLCGCSRAVNSPADELCLYRWTATLENGNSLELKLDDTTATFCAQFEEASLMLSGAYLIDDETLVISDSETRMNYCFSYLLHGDCVELSYGGEVIRLEKNSL